MSIALHGTLSENRASAPKRHARRPAVAAASTFLMVACGGAERRNPAAPSVNSRAATIESSVAASGAPSDTIALQPVVNSVDFPPRNEPFVFRQALEAKYRDGLGRTAQSSFVDIEGTIVWTQEYLRYRKNSCSHAEAVRRVFLQIDGFGVQPVCSFL